MSQLTPPESKLSAGSTSSTPGQNILLRAEGITLKFKGVTALDNVSFEVRPGELFAVIGPNGAGKTSLFNVLTRVYQPVSGSIQFAGRDLLSLKTDQLAAAGIART